MVKVTEKPSDDYQNNERNYERRWQRVDAPGPTDRKTVDQVRLLPFAGRWIIVLGVDLTQQPDRFHQETTFA